MPPGNCQVRIMAFVGGPCTDGAGKVVNRELADEMRSHKVSAPALTVGDEVAHKGGTGGRDGCVASSKRKQYV